MLSRADLSVHLALSQMNQMLYSIVPFLYFFLHSYGLGSPQLNMILEIPSNDSEEDIIFLFV